MFDNVSTVFLPRPVKDFLFMGEFLPYGYIIAGIVVNSVLACTCLVVGCVIVVFWKIWRSAWMYLLVLGLMTIGEMKMFCRFS